MAPNTACIYILTWKRESGIHVCVRRLAIVQSISNSVNKFLNMNLTSFREKLFSNNYINQFPKDLNLQASYKT